MTSQKVATRYAQSLVDLARERNQLDSIKQDVDSLLAMTENRDLALLLQSPVVNPSKKQSILTALLEKAGVDELVKAFIGIVVTKGREGDLPAILRAFNAQYKAINHISTVKVTSAIPLSDQSLEAIKQQLISSGKTESKVDLETAVDPDLLGGFVLETDGQVYDASVAHKLKELKKELDKPNVYVNNLEQ